MTGEPKRQDSARTPAWTLATRSAGMDPETAANPQPLFKALRETMP